MPQSTDQKWSQDDLIAFECACDTIAELISAVSSLIADQQHHATADAQQIERWEGVIQHLALERLHLHVADHLATKRIQRYPRPLDLISRLQTETTFDLSNFSRQNKVGYQAL
ncbi:MAG: hypothetical protein EON58_00280 [Alphaproteobacteria bacterium]|nr:MAG: hypothetical protein EON58_00280 [Alphaproteobacteria bacterium]